MLFTLAIELNVEGWILAGYYKVREVSTSIGFGHTHIVGGKVLDLGLCFFKVGLVLTKDSEQGIGRDKEAAVVIGR